MSSRASRFKLPNLPYLMCTSEESTHRDVKFQELLDSLPYSIDKAKREKKTKVILGPEDWFTQEYIDVLKEATSNGYKLAVLTGANIFGVPPDVERVLAICWGRELQTPEVMSTVKQKIK